MTGMADSNSRLETMIDLAVIEGLLANGTAPSVLSRASPEGSRSLTVLRRKLGYVALAGNANRWTDEELRYVRQHLGRLSLQDIGAHLGRSANAVKIMYQRQGWPAPSKQPEELTAHQIGKLLGKCVKTIIHMIDLGILPGRVLPSRRNIHVVRRITFECWLISPANWIYFKVQRIRDPRLRRLVDLARKRWPDEWLTTGQAARVLGLKVSGCIHQRIRRGKLPARRWANWWVLRSQVEQLHVVAGRGSPGRSRGLWTPAGDACLLRFRAEGKTWADISRLMGPRYSDRCAAYRFACLTGKRRKP